MKKYILCFLVFFFTLFFNSTNTYAIAIPNGYEVQTTYEKTASTSFVNPYTTFSINVWTQSNKIIAINFNTTYFDFQEIYGSDGVTPVGCDIYNQGSGTNYTCYFFSHNGISTGSYSYYIKGRDIAPSGSFAVISKVHVTIFSCNYINNNVESIKLRTQDILQSLNSAGIKLDTISSELQSLAQDNVDIKNKLDQNNNIQQQQLQQDQDQYNAEKQEESNREQQQSGDMAGIGFNFSVINPFSALFSAFSSSECVNVPTIASWLHLESSQICQWFPANVRSTLTPVISISSMLLLFGFVIHWIKGSSSNSSFEIGDGGNL